LNLKFYFKHFFSAKEKQNCGKVLGPQARKKKYLEPGLFFLRSPPNSKPKKWAELVFFQPGRGRKMKNEKSAGRYFRKKKKPTKREKKGGPPGKQEKNSNFARQPPTLAAELVPGEFFFCAGPVKKIQNKKNSPGKKVGLGLLLAAWFLGVGGEMCFFLDSRKKGPGEEKNTQAREEQF